MDDLKDTYNRIAKDWAQSHGSDAWWKEGTDKFISLVNRGDQVLDLGCGAGIKSKYLIERGLHVTGVDFSEEMINLAEKNAPGGKFLVMDIRNPRGIKGKFSGIFAHAVFLHFPKKEIEGLLAGWKTKLKPSGYFYVAVKELAPDGKEEEIVAENGYGYQYSRFFSYFTLEEVRFYFKNAGMDVVYEKIVSSAKNRWIQAIAR